MSDEAKVLLDVPKSVRICSEERGGRTLLWAEEWMEHGDDGGVGPESGWRHPGALRNGIALAVYNAMSSEVATLRKERDEAREIALTFGCVCGQPDDLCPTCEALDKLNARIASREGEEPGR